MEAIQLRLCLWCGGTLPPDSPPRRLYCSGACRKHAAAWRYRLATATPAEQALLLEAERGTRTLREQAVTPDELLAMVDRI